MADENGYTGRSQNQFMAGQQAIATLNVGIDKGGMRGIGLLAAAIAEFELKQKTIDLANDYYNTNAKDYSFFTGVHQPAIGASASEAFGINNPTYNWDFYASVPAAIAKVNKIDKQWFQARKRIPKYNIGQQARLDYDMGIIRMHAIAAGWNAGIRYELTWVEDHNNRAFARRASIVQTGIGVGNIIRSGLANSISSLSTSYDAMGDTIASIGNGYAAYSGYNDARQQVKQATNRSKQNG